LQQGLFWVQENVMMSIDAASSNPEDETERNLGAQPLDAVMTEHGISNHDLVAASKEPMTHKAVQRARKGRKLTLHMQKRMVAAVNAVLKAKDSEAVALTFEQVFNYRA
jgi:hypothetical protein